MYCAHTHVPSTHSPERLSVHPCIQAHTGIHTSCSSDDGHGNSGRGVAFASHNAEAWHFAGEELKCSSSVLGVVAPSLVHHPGSAHLAAAPSTNHGTPHTLAFDHREIP
jgi:hypothetical protein